MDIVSTTAVNISCTGHSIEFMLLRWPSYCMFSAALNYTHLFACFKGIFNYVINDKYYGPCNCKNEMLFIITLDALMAVD